MSPRSHIRLAATAPAPRPGTISRRCARGPDPSHRVSGPRMRATPKDSVAGGWAGRTLEEDFARYERRDVHFHDSDSAEVSHRTVHDQTRLRFCMATVSLQRAVRRACRGSLSTGGVMGEIEFEIGAAISHIPLDRGARRERASRNARIERRRSAEAQSDRELRWAFATRFSNLCPFDAGLDGNPRTSFASAPRVRSRPWGSACANPSSQLQRRRRRSMHRGSLAAMSNSIAERRRFGWPVPSWVPARDASHSNRRSPCRVWARSRRAGRVDRFVRTRQRLH